MAGEKKLFDLCPGTNRAYDCSLQGRVLRTIGEVQTEKTSGKTILRGGHLELERCAEFDGLKSFTIEAVIKVEPSSRPRRMMIIEAKTPPIRLYIQQQRDSRLVGAVCIGRRWITVQSNISFPMGRLVQVRFIRNSAGKIMLEIDGKKVGDKAAPGRLTARGNQGFAIGSNPSGTQYKFVGEIAQLRIFAGERTQADIITYQEHNRRIRQALIDQIGPNPNTIITVDPAEVDEKYEDVKRVMEFVGVQNLDDLSELSSTDISEFMSGIISPGEVIVAAPKPSTPPTLIGPFPTQASSFNAIAEEINDVDSIEEKKFLFDKYLTNRNSVRFLENAEVTPAERLLPERRMILGKTPPPRLSEMIRYEGNRVILQDPDLLNKLRSDNPADWPTPSPVVPIFYSTQLPMDFAVIMASKIDLQDIELHISHTVGTLFILAYEEIVFNANSKITIEYPGGSPAPDVLLSATDGDDGYTPTEEDVEGQTIGGSYTPKHGGDGKDGEDGDNDTAEPGSAGHRAPNIQLWAKRISCMPNIDLTGEDGFQGGKGQQGGKGGKGGDGLHGWGAGFVTYRGAGNGGDGGDGGDAGKGGKGGKCGKGGNINIRVLGELEDTIEAQRFKAKNTAGQPGDGGICGTPGLGGGGGSGSTDWGDGEDGNTGLQGRPRAGSDFNSDLEERTGDRGEVWEGQTGDGWWDLKEVTEEEFEEQLNRPWLTFITPTSLFPGDELTLYGARFASTDRVYIGPYNCTPAMTSSETMITVMVPDTENITIGIHDVYRVRNDGRESNRMPLEIKPQILTWPTKARFNETITLTGRGFMPDATVLYNGLAVPTDRESLTKLSFTVPAAGQANTTLNQDVTVQVRSMGLLSNSVQITEVAVLEYGWDFSRHSFSFKNPTIGAPSFDTFKQTYGESEVWTELFVPIFGHPLLVPAFYGFYKSFLKGKGAGGLATGFCTAVAALSCNEFWKHPAGHSNTFQNLPMKDSLRAWLTAIHGKLLSKEVLIKMHDQGREEQERVRLTALYIEHWFKYMKNRESAPLLFFLPSGSIWDGGYFDKLGDSHCILPVQFEYAEGQSPDELDPLIRLNNAKIYCYDSNYPYKSGSEEAQNCRVELHADGKNLGFEYLDGKDDQKFSFSDGITLGMMTLSEYYIADVSMPFSGPLGFMEFVLDFIDSPADLLVKDGDRNRVGYDNGEIVSEIEGSHPCYLIKNALLLPRDTALTRHITGNGQGKYKWCSILPNGAFLALEEVVIRSGEQDKISVNSDATQVVFTPGRTKSYTLFLARKVSDEFRTVRISGMKSGPSAGAVIALRPDLSLVRISNEVVRSSTTIHLTRTTMLGTLRHEYIEKDLTVSISINCELALTIPWNTLEAKAVSWSLDVI